MNAEYNYLGQTVQFEVQAENDQPPRTHKIAERSTCGKYITETIFVYDYYDIGRKVAVYSLMGTGKRPA